MQTIRTRIAPSPTGFPHIGTIYQVLFDFAFAKKHQGKFIVRIEDTDRSRFVEGAEKVIYESLQWFGLEADEDSMKGGPFGPYRQSERLPIYHEQVQKLINSRHAYYCFCSKVHLEEMRKKQEQEKRPPMYDKTCLRLSEHEIKENLRLNVPHVVRMKIPENRSIIVEDLVVGRVEFDSNTLDHQVILKSDGFPTYHLAVVVDDHLMHISHIFRGKEWLSSTPKHILLYEYFGWTSPIHAHLPLILNADGKGKLSKRHGHASVDYYRKAGFLPEAVLNYLSNIVWNHPLGIEIYDIESFIEYFDVTKLNSQGARFDFKKLEWMNGEYIRMMNVQTLAQKIHEFTNQQYPLQLVQKLAPLAQERMKTLNDFTLYVKPFTSSVEAVLNKDQQELLQKFKTPLAQINKWHSTELEHVSKEIVNTDKLPIREAFMAIRIAVTGVKVGLPLFETLEILGKETVMERLKRVLQ